MAATNRTANATATRAIVDRPTGTGFELAPSVGSTSTDLLFPTTSVYRPVRGSTPGVPLAARRYRVRPTPDLDRVAVTFRTRWGPTHHRPYPETMTSIAPGDQSIEDGDPQQPLTVTEEALATVLDVRAAEDDPVGTALRVAINGANMTDFVYELDLVPVAEQTDDDVVYTQGSHGELTVIVPAASVANMTGAVLDVASVGGGGLVIRNPNPPDPLIGLDLKLEGELPQKVQAVLDRAINPALASHGGYAALIGIEDETKAVVTMGGGCQGCAASAMTLRDGIRKMLMSALPEITDVIDATDHAAGENPFYTEAPM